MVNPTQLGPVYVLHDGQMLELTRGLFKVREEDIDFVLQDQHGSLVEAWAKKNGELLESLLCTDDTMLGLEESEEASEEVEISDKCIKKNCFKN